MWPWWKTHKQELSINHIIGSNKSIVQTRKNKQVILCLINTSNSCFTHCDLAPFSPCLLEANDRCIFHRVFLLPDQSWANQTQSSLRHSAWPNLITNSKNFLSLSARFPWYTYKWWLVYCSIVAGREPTLFDL